MIHGIDGREIPPRKDERSTQGGARSASDGDARPSRDGASTSQDRIASVARDPSLAHQLEVSEHAPWQQTAVDFFAGPEGSSSNARSGRRDGGLIERILLQAPTEFGAERTPMLEEARRAVLSREPEALDWPGARHDFEREIHLAQKTLARRIVADPRLDPMLHWHHGDLVVGVPSAIPGADRSSSARVWLSYSGDTAWARAERMDRDEIARCHETAAWTAKAESLGIPATVWRCALPSCCETEDPIVVEIAPNPTGFMHAMFIAHYGSAAIVAGPATGVDAMCRLDADARSQPRLLPSGWNYLKPDRTQGMSAPGFPNGAPRPARGVFVPDASLFVACARATWTVAPGDALRVAFAR
jgi:hypothetical protein